MVAAAGRLAAALAGIATVVAAAIRLIAARAAVAAAGRLAAGVAARVAALAAGSSRFHLRLQPREEAGLLAAARLAAHGAIRFATAGGFAPAVAREHRSGAPGHRKDHSNRQYSSHCDILCLFGAI